MEFSNSNLEEFIACFDSSSKKEEYNVFYSREWMLNIKKIAEPQFFETFRMSKQCTNNFISFFGQFKPFVNQFKPFVINLNFFEINTYQIIFNF